MKFQTKLKPTAALIDLTPLVDVVFLLLIFFIITSDILPLKSLHVENPSLTEDTTPLTTQLLVVMDAEQVIYLGSKKAIVDLEQLKSSLQHQINVLKKKNQGVEPTVVLSIDKHIEYGLFLQLLSIVQSCCGKVRLVYQHAQEPVLQTLENI